MTTTVALTPPAAGTLSDGYRSIISANARPILSGFGTRSPALPSVAARCFGAAKPRRIFFSI
ncbi:MAG: hypothetical protein ACXVEH_12450, partial [Nocardioides sp.]